MGFKLLFLATEPHLFANKFLPTIPIFRLKQVKVQQRRWKQQEPSHSTEPPPFPQNLRATSAETQTQRTSLRPTDNLTQPGKNPWKMCLWSKMDPGKPRTGSARSRAIYFLLPLPSPTHLGMGNCGAQDCITATQPFPFLFSTGDLSAQSLLITPLEVKAVSLGRGATCCK